MPTLLHRHVCATVIRPTTAIGPVKVDGFEPMVIVPDLLLVSNFLGSDIALHPTDPMLRVLIFHWACVSRFPNNNRLTIG